MISKSRPNHVQNISTSRQNHAKVWSHHLHIIATSIPNHVSIEPFPNIQGFAHLQTATSTPNHCQVTSKSRPQFYIIQENAARPSAAFFLGAWWRKGRTGCGQRENGRAIPSSLGPSRQFAISDESLSPSLHCAIFGARGAPKMTPPGR